MDTTHNQVKERPIIFTTDEVQAVLAGTLSQHRMPVIHKNELAAATAKGENIVYEGCSYEWRNGMGYEDDDIEQHHSLRIETGIYINVGECPLGNVSDRLWVQEYKKKINKDNFWFAKPSYSTYASIAPHDAHLKLQITDVRLERVRDITESNAISTGLKPDYCDHARVTCDEINCLGVWVSALEIYLNRMYGHKTHRVDDWVWVIDFKIVGGAA